MFPFLTAYLPTYPSSSANTLANLGCLLLVSFIMEFVVFLFLFSLTCNKTATGILSSMETLETLEISVSGCTRRPIPSPCITAEMVGRTLYSHRTGKMPTEKMRLSQIAIREPVSKSHMSSPTPGQISNILQRLPSIWFP